MFLIGLTITSFALPIAIKMFSALYTVSTNPMYRFANGMSEGMAAMIAIFAAFLAIAGICLMFYAWVKRRNKATLVSIENHIKENFCSKCKVNVSSNNGKCPICGKSLKEE